MNIHINITVVKIIRQLRVSANFVNMRRHIMIWCSVRWWWFTSQKKSMLYLFVCMGIRRRSVMISCVLFYKLWYISPRICDLILQCLSDVRSVLFPRHISFIFIVISNILLVVSSSSLSAAVAVAAPIIIKNYTYDPCVHTFLSDGNANFTSHDDSCHHVKNSM